MQSQEPRPSRGLLLLLGGGDLLVFLLFVLLGRADHGTSLGLRELLRGVAPFAIAWFALAPWLGAYRLTRRTSVRRAVLRVLPVWLLCGVLAILLRSWWYGRPIAPSFAAVALGFQAALLVGWRIAFVLLARHFGWRLP